MSGTDFGPVRYDGGDDYKFRLAYDSLEQLSRSLTYQLVWTKYLGDGQWEVHLTSDQMAELGCELVAKKFVQPGGAVCLPTMG